MSENNESVTQNVDVAFQLRALCQQLELLSRMNMDLKDDLKWIKKQNMGVDRRGNTICKAVPNSRYDFDVCVDENVDVGEDDYDGDMQSGSDKSYCEGMPPLMDSDGDELALPVVVSLVKMNLIDKKRISFRRVITNPEPPTRNTKPSTRNPKPEIPNNETPKHETLNLENPEPRDPDLRNPESQMRNPEPRNHETYTRNRKPWTLKPRNINPQPLTPYLKPVTPNHKCEP